jgi:hypothetical protein
MGDKIALFLSRKVITHWPAVPEAEAVAVKDGIVIAVGSEADLTSLGEHTIDDTFADKILMPGFVEAHAHVLTGALWQFGYGGYFDRRSPDGSTQTGAKSVEALLGRLREIDGDMADPDEPMLIWGFDPIYLPGPRLSAAELDTVSETRPIFVFHASAHLATVNSAMMRISGIGPDTDVEGVVKDASGNPIGELREPTAMALAASGFATIIGSSNTEAAIRLWGDDARNAGVTTMTDLGGAQPYNPDTLKIWHRVVNDDTFPARVAILPLFGKLGGPSDPGDFAELVVKLNQDATDKLSFPGVKLVLDGSIQGFTARLREPRYMDGTNGMWLFPPEDVPGIIEAFHRTGQIIFCHANGDEAVDLFLDAVEQVLTAAPRADHRYAVQHSQLTHPDQYRRMAALGVAANIFSNHTYFWGDIHVSSTVGPDRAAGMNAAATILREGVAFATHSDAPVTPLDPLHAAWAAVNRLTASGEVLGPHERISVADAMHAITLGAAYQLKMDHLIGSIEPGKNADFAVLEKDPYEVDPVDLRDIPIWGTVLGGRPFPAPTG